MVELDEQITLWLNSLYSDFGDTFFWYVSLKYTWFIIFAILVGFLFWKNGARNAFIFLLFVAVMILCADQLCNLFKYSVQRFRPCWDEDLSPMVHIVNGDRGGKFGFFSSHAAIFFGVAFMTSRLFKNKFYTIAIYTVATMVAYSRIYLGRHFLGDVLVGAIVGTLIAWAAMYFHEKFSQKLNRKHKRVNS